MRASGRRAGARGPGQTVVKRCPLCAARFTVSDLVGDAQIEPIGMAFLDDGYDQTHYYFTHTSPGCCTTFTVPVGVFAGLLGTPAPEQLLAGTHSCEGHCKRLGDLETCSNPCRNQPFRTFLVDVLVRRGKPPAKRA